MNKIRSLTLLLILLSTLSGVDQQAVYNTPEAGNPFIPGYFADPTVKKFGDTYYVYATTDGNGAGFGPSQVWSSKDFINWTLIPMNWPDSHWIWAPDVMKHAKDGKYYLIYCQPCQLYCGVSETPRGPWKNILGESEAVLVPDRFVTNAITLDGQTFVDDDGSIYLYWGTWGIYPGFGCGAGKMTSDMKSFSETRLIPNTEITDFFEAPFVVKRNGIYYFMYSSGSCHDHTYRVQYATSSKPMGPYEYKGCVLESSADGSIHGPGHHSVLQEGNDYYIVYHRHNNPHSNRGFHRQLCIDRMIFDDDGTIRKITPTHNGIGPLAAQTVQSENLAYGKKVRASSCYDDSFLPKYAVDDNNGTLWHPRSTGEEWIEIDLGHKQKIQTIWTQFEYATSYYQYIIETSTDGQHWMIFADKRNNHLAGSPMVDFGKAQARYIRLTFTGGEKNGLSGAIWNIKIFGGIEESCPQQWIGLTASDWDGRQWQNNEGMLGGAFNLIKGSARVQRIDGHNALVLEPGTTLEYQHPLLSPLKKHTISGWIYSSNQWHSYDAESWIKQGKILIQSKNDPLILTNFRFYNRKLEDVEKEHDAVTDIIRHPAAELQKKGLLISISANDFEPEDTITYIPNHGLKGGFEAQTSSAVVQTIKGRKAIYFDGTQLFHSNFMLPATMQDNASYTLEAWILNPEMEKNECIADFTTSHDELEKIMLINGTEPRCGIINHYGWYEDTGYDKIRTLENSWQHIYICFDGRIEQVYINGELISEKDIQLLLKPSQFVTLGRNAEGQWPFTGYLHLLKLYDEPIPFKK